jgi:hypothetical protein
MVESFTRIQSPLNFFPKSNFDLLLLNPNILMRHIFRVYVSYLYLMILPCILVTRQEHIVTCYATDTYFWHHLYNVGGPWSFLNPNCTCYSLLTPFGLVIPLLQSSITRNCNHTQLSITRLRVYTIIITYTLVTKVSYNTPTRLHWLTSQLSLLSRIITHSTSSHFPCLSPIETSLVELLPNTDP